MMCCSNFFIRVLLLGFTAFMFSACGGGTGSTSNTPAPTPNNVLSVVVDAGPAGSGYNVNRLFTQVKICQPGTTQCRTIDHVLVDTGSTGLRLLSSVISPYLSLNPINGTSSLPLLNCIQFVDNTFAWGPVATADIVLGGKTATSVPIQIMADPAYAQPAGTCAIGGTEMTTPTNLAANGILGLGLFKEDCGMDCTVNSANGFYYTCVNSGCTRTVGATASIDKQVKNPVPLFVTDNNGVLIDLPAPGLAASSSLAGSLIFGVGTQLNNQLGSANVMTTNANGYIDTALRLPGSQTLNFGRSFIDSGSNGFFFDAAAIPTCAGVLYSGFYCPNLQISLSATLTGTNAVSSLVTFSIENALPLFNDPSKAVLPGLAGPYGDSAGFDWGLPFFYGRRVFIGIEAQTPSVGAKSFYAF